MNNKEESKHQVDTDDLERFSNNISKLQQPCTTGKLFRGRRRAGQLVLEDIKVEVDYKRAKKGSDSKKTSNAHIKNSVDTRS